MGQCKVCKKEASVDAEGTCEACMQKKIFAEISKRIPEGVTEVPAVSNIFRVYVSR